MGITMNTLKQTINKNTNIKGQLVELGSLLS